MSYTAYECWFWDQDEFLIDEAEEDFYANDDLIADMWELATAEEEE